MKIYLIQEHGYYGKTRAFKTIENLRKNYEEKLNKSNLSKFYTIKCETIGENQIKVMAIYNNGKMEEKYNLNPYIEVVELEE